MSHLVFFNVLDLGDQQDFQTILRSNNIRHLKVGSLYFVVDRDVVFVRSHCEWIGEGIVIGTMPDGMEADLFSCSRKLPGDAIDQIGWISINFTGRLHPIQVVM